MTTPPFGWKILEIERPSNPRRSRSERSELCERTEETSEGASERKDTSKYFTHFQPRRWEYVGTSVALRSDPNSRRADETNQLPPTRTERGRKGRTNERISGYVVEGRWFPCHPETDRGGHRFVVRLLRVPQFVLAGFTSDFGLPTCQRTILINQDLSFDSSSSIDDP